MSCTPEIKEKMDSLLQNSQYNSYSDIFSIAIENLWVLNNEIGTKGALLISGSSSSLSFPITSSHSQKKSSIITNELASTLPDERRLSKGQKNYPASVSIPEIFLSDGLDQLSLSTIDIPQEKNIEKSFTLDRWLFGQYNRLLPAKVNCRALVHLVTSYPTGIPLSESSALIANAAMIFGDFLTDYDKRHRILRDDTFATAFPQSGPDNEKSRSRYSNQFVGCVNSRNNLSGLLSDYRLIGLTSEKGIRILPTDQAVHFAKLHNPILDTSPSEPIQKFSSEEISFLLDHIRLFIPVEQFTFCTLINIIEDGANTPEKIDESLRFLAPIDSKRSFSPAFLSSQRSGALSRMADLNLITRERKGVRVFYIVTKQGHSLVEVK
jgi:hypothetical protein